MDPKQENAKIRNNGLQFAALGLMIDFVTMAAWGVASLGFLIEVAGGLTFRLIFVAFGLAMYLFPDLGEISAPPADKDAGNG